MIFLAVSEDVQGVSAIEVEWRECGHLNYVSLPEDVIILIPRTRTVTSHGKRGFADVIKVKVLSWEDDPV